MQLNGIGGPRELNAGLLAMTFAAEQGHVKAQISLGVAIMYDDPVGAAKWFQAVLAHRDRPGSLDRIMPHEFDHEELALLDQVEQVYLPMARERAGSGALAATATDAAAPDAHGAVAEAAAFVVCDARAAHETTCATCRQPLDISTLTDQTPFVRQSCCGKSFHYTPSCMPTHRTQPGLRCGLCNKLLQVENSKKQVRQYLSWAKRGYAWAQTHMGAMYYQGVGQVVKKSHSTAAQWHSKAAKAGDAVSQHALGCMYLQGEGVERSVPMAKRLFALSAEQGYRRAMWSLARLLLQEGMTRVHSSSTQEALRWLQRAADLGDEEAQREALQLASRLAGSKEAHQCAMCGKTRCDDGTVLQRCATCKIVYYCGAACQKAHWPEHKLTHRKKRAQRR